MARGYPDYANPVYTLASKNIDFGVLATGLMRAHIVDARGRIVYWDHFEEGLRPWDLNYQGDGAAPVAYTANAEHPPVSAYLDAGSGAGNGGSWMYKRVYVGASTRVGAQFGVGFSVDATKMTITLDYNTEALLLRGQVLYYSDTGILSIKGATGEHNIAVLEPFTVSKIFIPFKLVIDADLKTFWRLVVGNYEWDLSAYTLLELGVDLIDCIRAEIRANPIGAAVTSMTVGHCLITYDEP